MTPRDTTTCLSTAAHTTTLDVVTALATTAAVLVAIAAVGAGLYIASRERKNARLLERQRALVELLASFEAVQAYMAPVFKQDGSGQVTTHAEADPHGFEVVRARYRANLYASGEPLPYTRRAAFSHFGAPPPEPDARLEGNAEIEDPSTRAFRGEILTSLDEVRRQILGNAKAEPPPRNPS